MTDRSAPADHPILPVLADRWSPRAFADRPVEPQKLAQLFEAARWAASSFNEQPWRFILAIRDNEAEFARALACLVEFNQQWARTAPVLVLTAVSTAFAKNGKPNRCAQHDLGLAMGNLSAQATALGLVLHQMAGVEPEKIRETYAVPDGFEPMTAFALGYLGDPQILPERMRDGESAPRIRKPLSETVFAGQWDRPADL
jgi:nitroreductase